jgi:hypothetical protein
MTTLDRELLQQALEALEDSVPINAEKHWKLVEAIRAHLAKPEPEPVAIYRGIEGEYRYEIVSMFEEIPEGTLLFRKEDM